MNAKMTQHWVLIKLMIDYARFARAINLKETCLNGYIVSTHPTVPASNHNLPNQTKIHEWSDYRCGKSVRVCAGGPVPET